MNKATITKKIRKMSIKELSEAMSTEQWCNRFNFVVWHHCNLMESLTGWGNDQVFEDNKILMEKVEKFLKATRENAAEADVIWSDQDAELVKAIREMDSSLWNKTSKEQNDEFKEYVLRYVNEKIK